jgi:predicted membrane protein
MVWRNNLNMIFGRCFRIKKNVSKVLWIAYVAVKE